MEWANGESPAIYGGWGMAFVGPFPTGYAMSSKTADIVPTPPPQWSALSSARTYAPNKPDVSRLLYDIKEDQKRLVDHYADATGEYIASAKQRLKDLRIEAEKLNSLLYVFLDAGNRDANLKKSQSKVNNLFNALIAEKNAIALTCNIKHNAGTLSTASDHKLTDEEQNHVNNQSLAQSIVQREYSFSRLGTEEAIAEMYTDEHIKMLILKDNLHTIGSVLSGLAIFFGSFGAFGALVALICAIVPFHAAAAMTSPLVPGIILAALVATAVVAGLYLHYRKDPAEVEMQSQLEVAKKLILDPSI